jgi:hypothetical protein
MSGIVDSGPEGGALNIDAKDTTETSPGNDPRLKSTPRRFQYANLSMLPCPEPRAT